MEGWGFEFPFNHRSVFTAEWEELWMRYLIARYDAYNASLSGHRSTSTSITRTATGTTNRGRPLGDARRALDQGHRAARPYRVDAQWAGAAAFAERFRADPEAVDAIMFQ